MKRSIEVEKQVQLRGHNAAVYHLSAFQNGASFLSAGGDGWIVQWDIEDPDPGQLIAKVDRQIFSLCSVPEENLLLAGNMDGGLHWVYPDEPSRNQNIAHHQKGVFGIQQIGAYLYTLGGQGTITRWSIERGQSLESFQLSNRALRGMAYSSVRGEIAIGASDSNIYLLDADSLEIRRVISQAHEPSVFALQYTPDGHHLLSGGRDAHLKAWDCQHQFELISDQAAHWYTINDIQFHPKSQFFATASRDKSIKIWDAGTFKLLKVLDRFKSGGHLNSVNRLLWAEEGQKLISASDDRSLIIWEFLED